VHEFLPLVAPHRAPDVDLDQPGFADRRVEPDRPRALALRLVRDANVLPARAIGGSARSTSSREGQGQGDSATARPSSPGVRGTSACAGPGTAPRRRTSSTEVPRIAMPRTPFG